MSDIRIFIVEDEAVILMDIESTLERLGYKVIGSAFSGEDALEKLEDLSPDLVLMDIQLQGKMDGVSAAKRVHRLFDIPVVFLTAHADQTTIKRAMKTEPFGYVVKPFNDRELNAVIELSLSRHKMDKRLRTMEQNLLNVSSGTKDGIVVVDMEGSYLFCNQMAENIMTSYLFDPVTSKDGFVLEEGEGRKRIELFSPKMERKSIELTMAATEWEGKEARLITISDITEYLETERQLRSESYRDELTEVLNRRGFFALAKLQLRMAERRWIPTVLAFVDVDGLTEINDLYGHAMGDVALRETSQILQQVFRSSDVIGRIGGDEFAILAAMDTRSTDKIRQRLKEALDARNRESDLPFPVSLSIGFVNHTPSPTMNGSLEMLMQTADREMYKHKRLTHPPQAKQK